MWNIRIVFTVTDEVVLVSWEELKAQGEGREELKRLRELKRPVGAQGPVALPALEALDKVVAGDVAVVANHVKDIALHALRWQWYLVVRAVDVEVVVDCYLHCVLSMYEPADKHRQ